MIHIVTDPAQDFEESTQILGAYAHREDAEAHIRGLAVNGREYEIEFWNGAEFHGSWTYTNDLTHPSRVQIVAPTQR